MSATEVIALFTALIAAAIAGALAVTLIQLRTTLRDARTSLEATRADAVAAIEELRGTTRRAGYEIERVDALVSTAEGIGARADRAGRVVQATVQSPVVKTMALGTGARRAVRRLRGRR